MSGGTPTYMRQRHSHGYASSGDDLELEDDASLLMPPQSTLFPTTRSWLEVLENGAWIISAVFIVYFGDFNSNLIYLLFHDDRIKRFHMYVGLFSFSLNVIYFLYTSMLAWGIRTSSEKWELSATYALPLVTFLGVVSFCLFSFALWPIWSFLTLPLVFTLLMASMVILPYLVLGTCRQQPSDILRID